mmetsp:Transcript_19676/g.23605  ORF Transcript_19676/g.23605 Transcript_19676/m.23605 type:complete len:492 (+) Transcript_19676:279-1754(+)|eukprot:CAMPEP_0197850030 /NCGR_PEP_ID=MMETSP1438-20131217/14028_1 /TAXON_ID=1461541 /ORGANISM="Pterosperma sp., Strain CCMP1384" /LENGTH=491 /DNA_ID=CAMNT_0043462979 /DNA_START=261 /DNA_END=1736 /DNA_ORIENTATION=+
MFMSEDIFTDGDPNGDAGDLSNDGPKSARGSDPLSEERQVYTGGSGSPPTSRPGTASQPVRPVSARTFANAADNGPGPSGMNVYNNDLFGDEDVNETEISVTSQPKAQAAARQRMEQQKALAAQKRKERSMMSGAVVKNDTVPRSRPGSAIGSRPNSAAVNRSMENYNQSSSSSEEPRATDDENQGAEDVQRDLQNHGLRAVYDPLSEKKQQQPDSIPRPLASASVDTSDMRVFLMQPGPRTGPILCHIRRQKGSAKLYPKYALYIGGGGIDGEDATERFLLSARKRKKSKSSNYLISLDEEDMSRQSGNYFGKLRSNFVGTEFTIYDKGIKPNEVDASGNMSQMTVRTELGAVLYQYNVLGTRGPRKMTVMIPKVNDQDQRFLFRPEKETDGILERYKESGETENLVVMRNKPPKWNEQMQAYCLNFHGRVTHASVKNFQLVDDEDKDRIILQFGKVGKDTFTMDYQWPMSALQAFSICLTSFDNKLACE